MTLIHLFLSSAGVKEQNLFFSTFDFMLSNQPNILEAHLRVLEMEEHAVFCWFFSLLSKILVYDLCSFHLKVERRYLNVIK